MSNFKNRLKIIKDENRYRERISLYSAQDTIVRVEGKSVTNFAINNNLSISYIDKLKKHPSVYYPVLSEIFSLMIFYWVRKRSKNSM